MPTIVSEIVDNLDLKIDEKKDNYVLGTPAYQMIKQPPQEQDEITPEVPQRKKRGRKGKNT